MSDPRNLADIAARIRALSEADRLRLAADLLDRGKVEFAYRIAEDTTLEIGARVMLRRMPGGTG